MMSADVPCEVHQSSCSNAVFMIACPSTVITHPEASNWSRNISDILTYTTPNFSDGKTIHLSYIKPNLQRFDSRL